MNTHNKHSVQSVSPHVSAWALAILIIIAPGVSMAGHQYFGVPHHTFGLHETTTGQVGCLFVWLVDDGNPHSSPVTDPALRTNIFAEVYIYSWTGHPDDLPGINAQGHLLALPQDIVEVIDRNAGAGFAAPLSEDLGGHGMTFGSPTTANHEFLALLTSELGTFVAPIDVDNLTSNETGLDTPRFEVQPLRQGGGTACREGGSTMCLQDNRFKVEVDWDKPGQNPGVGQVIEGGAEDVGAFWFIDPTNIDLLVRLENHCSDSFSSFWVFAAAATDVEYTLTVTDTQTGLVKEYTNPLGSAAPVLDTEAFATCP